MRSASLIRTLLSVSIASSWPYRHWLLLHEVLSLALANTVIKRHAHPYTANWSLSLHWCALLCSSHCWLQIFGIVVFLSKWGGKAFVIEVSLINNLCLLKGNVWSVEEGCCHYHLRSSHALLLPLRCPHINSCNDEQYSRNKRKKRIVNMKSKGSRCLRVGSADI